MQHFDVAVIGAGPAGLAAAKAAKEGGAEKVLLLERDNRLGGILNQCVHMGFGIVKYNKQLTGPEFACRAAAEAVQSGIEIWTDAHVESIEAGQPHTIRIIRRSGIKNVRADAVIMATGCRERTRGAISIPGSRPAGVYTAGLAQNFINMRNIAVGKKVVILGSGDIGLIMARRLTLEGAEVLCVLEVMPEPTGLARNVSQCLRDFNIPLYTSHTVANIYGKARLEGVDIAKVDENKHVIPGTEKHIDCDTLILSVGLIPENEVALTAGISLAKNNGASTDQYLMTNVPGIFAAGNCKRVMDLADYASAQGKLAGENAAKYLKNEALTAWDETTGTTMVKGFPTEGSVTCTLCPNGCQVTENPDGSFTGNRCKRGAAFAKTELTAPERVVTGTVRIEGRDLALLPVRTAGPVPKSMQKFCAAQFAKMTAKLPVKPGDVIGTVDCAGPTEIIATAEMR